MTDKIPDESDKSAAEWANNADGLPVESAKKILDLSQGDDSEPVRPKTAETIRNELLTKAKEGFVAFAKAGELVDDEDPTLGYWDNSGSAARSAWDVRASDTSDNLVVERRFNDSSFSATEDFGLMPEDPSLKGVIYSFRSDGQTWADDWGDKRGKYVGQQPYPIESGRGLQEQPTSRPINDEELMVIVQASGSIVPHNHKLSD